MSPDPLFTHPLIHRDKSGVNNLFLIPSPTLYIRAFRQSLFSALIKSSDLNSIGDNLGNAIELHIQEALEHIFNADNVQKLEGQGKHADFLISLENIDLIVEVKTMIGGIPDKSVMRPDHIAKMWNRFYGACVQCASSQTEHRQVGRQTISIILIADHLTAEYLPFQHYASLTGIFDDLGIEAIEFFVMECIRKQVITNISKGI